MTSSRRPTIASHPGLTEAGAPRVSLPRGLPPRLLWRTTAPMESDFWRTAWREGRTGFHLGSVNPHLLAHQQVLRGTRVFVPMCGKSHDLAFLAQRGRQVVGVELSELAVTQFFEEQQLTPSVHSEGELTRYEAGAITIFCGDLFALTAEQLGHVEAFYDRAALVALPAELRRRYVAHLSTLLPAPVVGLL